MTTMY